MTYLVAHTTSPLGEITNASRALPVTDDLKDLYVWLVDYQHDSEDVQPGDMDAADRRCEARDAVCELVQGSLDSTVRTPFHFDAWFTESLTVTIVD